MQRLVVISWVALVLLHLPPAIVLFAPSQMAGLYGEAPQGAVAVMLQHRAALFLCLCIVGVAAVFQPAIRQTAVVVFAISMMSFIVLYGLAGWQSGPLRTIAIADAVGLAPWSVVAISAFRSE